MTNGFVETMGIPLGIPLWFLLFVIISGVIMGALITMACMVLRPHRTIFQNGLSSESLALAIPESTPTSVKEELAEPVQEIVVPEVIQQRTTTPPALTKARKVLDRIKARRLGQSNFEEEPDSSDNGQPDVFIPASRLSKNGKLPFKQHYWYIVDNQNTRLTSLRDALQVLHFPLEEAERIDWRKLPSEMRKRIRREPVSTAKVSAK